MNERNIEQLKYLDTILVYLRNGISSSYLFKDLLNVFEENNISFDSKLETEFKDTSDNTIHINGLNIEGFREQVFNEAIIYLNNLGLVFIEMKAGNTDKTIALTYKGRIKLTSSFVDEYKKELFDKALRDQHMKYTKRVARIQIWTLPLAIAVALLAIWVNYCTS